MDSEQKTIVLTLATILVGIAALVNEEYRVYLVVLYPIFVIIYLFSSYLNKIDENEKQIKEINKKLDIYERLARLEGVLKMNKRGLTDRDVLDWIKMAIALIVGYIVIKALLQAVATI